MQCLWFALNWLKTLVWSFKDSRRHQRFGTTDQKGTRKVRDLGYSLWSQHQGRQLHMFFSGKAAVNWVKKTGHGMYRQCIHVQLKRWTSKHRSFWYKKQYLQAIKCDSAQTSPGNSSPFTECDIQSMLVQKADAESKGLLFLSAHFHCCPPSLEVQKRGYWSMTSNIRRRNR